MTGMDRQDIEALLARCASEGEAGVTPAGEVVVAYPHPHEQTVQCVYFGDMEDCTGADMARSELLARAPAIIRNLLTALDQCHATRWGI